MNDNEEQEGRVSRVASLHLPARSALNSAAPSCSKNPLSCNGVLSKATMGTTCSRPSLQLPLTTICRTAIAIILVLHCNDIQRENSNRTPLSPRNMEASTYTYLPCWIIDILQPRHSVDQNIFWQLGILAFVEFLIGVSFILLHFFLSSRLIKIKIEWRDTSTFAYEVKLREQAIICHEFMGAIVQ